MGIAWRYMLQIEFQDFLKKASWFLSDNFDIMQIALKWIDMNKCICATYYKANLYLPA